MPNLHRQHRDVHKQSRFAGRSAFNTQADRRGPPWWAQRGPGRHWEGLISDVADRINRRNNGDLPSPHSHTGVWNEIRVVECRLLWNTTKRLSVHHPDRWTYQKLADRYHCSRATAGAVATGKYLPRYATKEDV